MTALLRKVMKKNNNGSSIVVVIVALAFVGILAATIMWMALNNFYMKATDTKNKRSFYSSENVMEEIMAGLQADVSTAIDLSYRDVMQKYATKSEEDRQKAFRDAYLNRLQEIFNAGGGANTYQISKLRGYVNGFTDPTQATFSVTGEGSGTLTALRGTPKVATETGELVKYTSDAVINKNYILLKDIHLEFVDANGFVSIINTDIQLVLPETSFTQSSTMPDIFEYALVATDTLQDQEMATFGNPVVINGNVYGGENGITIHHNWEFNKGSFLVTDKDIELNKAGASLKVGDKATSDQPMVWADNLKLTKGTGIDLYAKTYLSDDTIISASNTVVKLQGQYFGYGDSLTDSTKSSAIVINGLNTELDLSKLDEMLIAGHSYIGTANAVGNIAPSVSDNAIYQNNKNVLMGESIAIKGDQIAYLVPDQCIGVLDGEDKYGKNPMSAKEYESLQTELKKCGGTNKYIDDEGKEHTLYEVDFNKTVTALGSPLSNYTTEIKKVFVPSNGETIVYYYLVMDETNANRYFETYYHIKKAKLDQYFKVYAKGIKSNAGFTRINTQGNWLSDAAAKTPIDQTLLNTPTPMPAAELGAETKRYADMFASLQSKLIMNYHEVSNAEKAKSVYENIVVTDNTTLNTFMFAHPTAVWTTDDATPAKAVITKGDYTFDGTQKVRLIIAKGNVTIKADYTGLIISGGNILIDKDVKISNASEATAKEELTKVLQVPFDPADPDSTKPIDFFRNGSNYILAGTLVSTTGMDSAQKEIDFSKLVLYENWTKQ